MVVIAIAGVVKLVPFAIKVPPVGASYQLKVPLDATAFRVTVPVPQRLAGVVDVMLGVTFTVAVTAVRTNEVQLPLVASA